MMEDYLTPGRIANSILQKTSFKGSYLIVEGNNDFSLYKKFIDNSFCKIEIAFGNQNVIDIIEELKKRGYENVIGVIDSDYRRLENDLPSRSNILLTDFHDIEVMLFSSDAFETVMSHYSILEKVEAFKTQNKNNDLREIFLNLARPLGYLKWANKINNWGLVFKPIKPEGKPLSYSDFIPPDTLKFTSYEEMTQTVINYTSSKSKTKTKTEAVKLTKKLIDNNTHSSLQICNGHDIIHIICLSLRKKISNLNSNAVKAEQLEKDFIFAYDSRYFEQTELYKQIKQWEIDKGKSVLKF